MAFTTSKAAGKLSIVAARLAWGAPWLGLGRPQGVPLHPSDTESLTSPTAKPALTTARKDLLSPWLPQKYHETRPRTLCCGLDFPSIHAQPARTSGAASFQGKPQCPTPCGQTPELCLKPQNPRLPRPIHLNPPLTNIWA